MVQRVKFASFLIPRSGKCLFKKFTTITYWIILINKRNILNLNIQREHFLCLQEIKTIYTKLHVIWEAKIPPLSDINNEICSVWMFKTLSKYLCSKNSLCLFNWQEKRDEYRRLLKCRTDENVYRLTRQ